MAALLLAATGTAVWTYLHSRQSRYLTAQDTIVLADFTNTTGESIFDDTLRQGLSERLAQSPFLSLLPDSRIARTLVTMAQPKGARLTQKLAREVCHRAGCAATIEGSISRVGGQYVLGLRAVNCQSGDLLAEEQATANGQEQVLKALGAAVRKVRPKLGESLASVQKHDAPRWDLTTVSLEAFKAYSLAARETITKGDDAASIPFLQKAISLDPNFAMAYAGLGGVYCDTGQTARGIEYYRKAYELRERVSENEKFMITSLYEMQGTGNLEAARKELGLWTQNYPRDPAAAGNLAAVCTYLGEYQNALAAAQEALKLSPATGRAYEDLAGNYMYLNRLDEARATAGEAHKLGDPGGDIYLYQIDFLQHDAAGMEKDVAALMGKPGSEDVVLGLESDTAAYAGQFALAREFTQRAVASARAADEQETAAGYLATSALRDALAGNLDLAMRQAQAGLALSNGRDVTAASAMVLALAGDSSKAGRLAGDLAKRFPEYTSVQIEFLPMIQACTWLGIGHEAKDAAKAMEALTVAARHELGI